MFYDPRLNQIYLYTQPIDCRKAHNGLIFLVTHVMAKEFSSGAIFLFVSRDRKTAKAIKWEGTGATVLHKKMERGRIMTFSELELVLELTNEAASGIWSGGQVRLDLKF